MRVHVYQFKLKGLAMGGGGEGWVSAMSLYFAKMVVRHISLHLRFFKSFCFDHISHENLLFFRLII